jgi:hypothetical protein
MNTETLEQAMGWDTPAKPLQPFTPAVLDGTPTLPPPGIYFGMPETEYHELPALSSHGVRDIASSPMLYWSKIPFLSQIARKRKAERDEKEKLHHTVGKAYHCRIMEGLDAFRERFAVWLTEEECRGALDGTDQIKAAINAAGHKPMTKVPDRIDDGTVYMRAAKKSDWIAQLLMINPDARILDKLNEQHAFEHRGKSFITDEAYEQIEIAAKMIEADPEVRHAFTGGHAEVVLIWYCPKTGVPMKARCDYLKLKAIVDLKTVANQQGRSIERAIAYEVANYRYAIQPSVYVEGVNEVRKLVREKKAHVGLGLGGGSHMFGETVPQEIRKWVMEWANQEECEWLWVFQQKGDAPITRGVWYPLRGSTRSVTDHIVTKMKQKFRQFSELFGTDPWLDTAPIYDMADEDLPPWATEI